MAVVVLILLVVMGLLTQQGSQVDELEARNQALASENQALRQALTGKPAPEAAPENWGCGWLLLVTLVMFLIVAAVTGGSSL